MKKAFKFIIVLIAISCKDPFEPPVGANEINYLTVDGTINATDGIVSVKLSKAVKLSSSEEFPVIEDATVTVEKEGGATYQLFYMENGVYELSGGTFSVNEKYKLRIVENNGKKYSSDYVQVLKAPEVDTLQWQPSADGVSVYVSSKSDSESTNYFRWTYTETWQYNSTVSSILEINNEVVSLRPPSDQIYTCWATHESTDILVKSTDLYSSNLISNFRLAFIPSGSQRLSSKYSVLVQQTSLTREAYNFWDQLKKISQGTGGLFDPLPSAVVGNITSETDPNEIVLGYFSASTISTKRIFIANYDLPEYLHKVPPALDCEVTNVPLGDFAIRDKNLVIIATYGQPVVLGYTFSSKECVDCRYQGGTNVKPVFWN